jgi:16S rRNA (adenine1518-N6/adenine1519-N6)-dimethyltransferase
MGPRRRVGPHARRRFGQHFLERHWAEAVVAAIRPERDQTFVEIGPGRGALTRPLAERAGVVLAFEIDRDLAATLPERVPANVEIVAADFLEITAETIRARLSATGAPTGPLRVVGNLPYNVGAPILFKLAALYAGGLPIVDATVMLQEEVVDRLTAPPATAAYGTLSVLIGHVAAVSRLLSLPPGAFRPPPKVRSAVAVLRFHAPDPPVLDDATFRGLVQAVFTRRRKTIANALKAYRPSGPLAPSEALDRAHIRPSLRPEALTVAQFASLANLYAGGA